MTETEELKKRQAEMSNEELIERANKEVSELARTYGRSHRMTIPPMITDTDIILDEVIRRFVKALDSLRVSISLERAKKYAAHQHFRGSLNQPFVEYDDWKGVTE
jgi:plasmid maintenance system antidote protein VapI